MTQFEIEYTTNLDDRHTVTMSGESKTDVYIKFVCDNPTDYIITDMKEIG